MLFLTLNKLLPIESQHDLYIFWQAALALRRSRPHTQKQLAQYVFATSNLTRKTLHFDDMMNDITYEFAALETPAVNARETHAMWIRLENIVNSEFLKITS